MAVPRLTRRFGNAAVLAAGLAISLIGMHDHRVAREDDREHGSAADLHQAVASPIPE
jgi:hypothetical protein